MACDMLYAKGMQRLDKSELPGLSRFMTAAGLVAYALIAAGLLVAAQEPAPTSPDGAALQAAVDRAMAGRSGTVVVAHVGSGRLLAQHRMEVAARRRVLPGSTLKPFTLQALLDAQVVRPDTRFACPLQLKLAGHRMDCSHPRQPGPFDATSALALSCNNYFAHFAARLDDSTLDRAFAQAGLISVTGLAADEAVGRVQRSGSPAQHRLKALGAADVQVTPLGLLSAYRRLAYIRRQDSGGQSPSPVFAGLEASVERGLAQAAGVEGMSVAGKTGTAAAVEGNWTHAWFAGYAPADKPEIVLVVFLERGTGASDASPVARQIFEAFHQSRRQP